MEHKEFNLLDLADKKLIVVDYSDKDILIIDTIKQLTEPNTTRIKMNMVAIAKQGKAQVQLNGKTITFEKNQVLMCPPNTMFVDFLFSSDFSFKAIFLTNGIIQSFLREKMNIWNDMMYIHKIHIMTMSQRDIEFLSHFMDALSLSITAPADRYPYRSEIIQGLLRSAFLGLCGALKQMLPSGDNHAPHSQANVLFQQFLDMVNSSQTKSSTVEDYAAKLCVSAKYLTSVCRKISGKTANEWIREHMLEEIRYYLKQTDMPIKQVADRLGFASPSFFGKYVKEHLGVTPRQFRLA